VSAVARKCNAQVRRVFEIVEQMLALADEGDRDRDSGSCGILFGVLRDSAYRLRRLAEQERERRTAEGNWD
jgi:hypothetical protein